MSSSAQNKKFHIYGYISGKFTGGVKFDKST